MVQITIDEQKDFHMRFVEITAIVLLVTVHIRDQPRAFHYNFLSFILFTALKQSFQISFGIKGNILADSEKEMLKINIE